MKNVARKIASMVLAVAVTSNLFTVGGIVGKKDVEAAASKWVLVSTKPTMSEPEIDRTSRAEYSYEVVEGDKVVIKSYQTCSEISGNEKYAYSRDEYYECTQPPETITPGEKVTLKMRNYTDNIQLGSEQKGYPKGSCQAYIDTPDLNDFTTVADYGDFYSTDRERSLGLADWNTFEVDLSMTVYANMPKASDFKTGDRVSIYFHVYDRSNISAYEWQYQLKAGGSDDDDDAATIGEDSDDEDDIVVGQVKNVKLTNKKVKRIYISYSKVSGAKGYQIRYATKKSMSGAKKLTTTATKGYFKNAKGKKATFKKGKTYYVQVRAYAKNSSGTKVYGKWSAKKKVKIKK